MRLIYQVAGRLPGGSEDYSVIDYRVGDKVLRDFRISSDALRSMEPDDSRVVILFPISLLYREFDVVEKWGHLQDLEEEFASRFDEYMKGPFDSFVIQSMGKYGDVEFRSDYDLIVLRIMSRMIRDYLEYNPDEVVVDVSTGLNVNVSALLEAFRYFLIWVKLYTYGEEDSVHFYRAFSELVMEGYDGRTYRIHIKGTGAKAFFLSPLNVPDLKDLPAGINVSLLRRFLLVFTSLYRNAPLYIYHAGFDEPSLLLDEIKSVVGRVLNDTGTYSVGEGIVEFPVPFDRRKMTNVLLSLALYRRISGILEEYLGEDYGDRYRKRGISMRELREVFVEGIYQRFYLEMNAYLLSNELENIREAVERNRRVRALYSRTFHPLSPAFTGDLSRDQCGADYRPIARNFLAHAGFERCLILAHGSGENLRFRYRDGVEEFVENTLLNIDPTF